MAEARFEILGLGVSTVDDLLTVETFPTINTKQKVLARTRQCGGLTGTALVAASRQGCRCGYLITLGEGELSAFTRRELSRENIRLVEPGDRPDAEPYHSLIITERAGGERSVLWDNSKVAPPRFGPRELELAFGAGCLFVDHIFAAQILDVVVEARRRGIPVVGDFERSTPRSGELMDATDHLIVPLYYARELFGDGIGADAAARELAASPGRSLACVTDGVRGAWYALGSDPDAVRLQTIFPMETIVDSTGCGDVFHGVYAAGLARGDPPAVRIRRAAAAAALKTRKTGAQAGAPTLAELESFLAERGEK